MRFLMGIIVVGLVAFVGALAWAMRYDEIAPITAPPAAAAYDRATLELGERMAGIGDCDVCHTRPNGEPYAGGLPLPTPFGTIYVTNITPDPETGIGNWSLEAFTRAMREGVDREGNYLYPAFPYNHFTLATDKDIEAIYAYIMTRVRPVKYTAPENEMPFPFNIRLGVAGWNLLFLKKGEYQADTTKSAEWNRGAYLVEGLGHCGACHTPLNFIGAQKGGDQKFGGGEAEGWHAPALNKATPAPIPWTKDALVNYLFDGWDKHHGITAGPMTPVINHLSMQDEDDVYAMAEYIASFQPTAPANRTAEAVAWATEREWNPDPAYVPRHDDPQMQRGAEVFKSVCANCHKRGGQPVPLGLTITMNMPDPRNVLRITMEGIRPPRGARDRSMPQFSQSVRDEDMVALMYFMRKQYTTKPAWDGVADYIREIRNPATH